MFQSFCLFLSFITFFLTHVFIIYLVWIFCSFHHVQCNWHSVHSSIILYGSFGSSKPNDCLLALGKVLFCQNPFVYVQWSFHISVWMANCQRLVLHFWQHNKLVTTCICLVEYFVSDAVTSYASIHLLSMPSPRIKCIHPCHNLFLVLYARHLTSNLLTVLQRIMFLLLFVILTLKRFQKCVFNWKLL